jgi:radical SAM protein with 4Fe4S-binding SPASM domain
MTFDQRELKRRLVLRLKGIEEGRALIGPATVQIHLTDVCNLECKYCYYFGPGSAIRPTSKNHLPYEQFEKIAADCAGLHVDTFHLSGIGEPTLHPRFYDMLKRLENNFAVTIYSNATFPLERCRDILRADRIVINLGEADRKSYRELQGRDLFMKVIKNIRELARLRPQFNPLFRIEVVFVETRLNTESFDRTEALVKKLGADLVQRKTAHASDHTRHFMLEDALEEREQANGEWPPCYHGWFYSSIKLNGLVNVCCFQQRLTIGNVFETSFKDVWESPAYAKARVSALTGDTFKNYEECANCKVAWRNKEIGKQLDMYDRVRK